MQLRHGASLGGRSADWNMQLKLSVGWSAGRINRSTSLIIVINDDKWITIEWIERPACCAVVACWSCSEALAVWIGYINKCTQHKAMGERKKEKQSTLADRQRKRDFHSACRVELQLKENGARRLRFRRRLAIGQ